MSFGSATNKWFNPRVVHIISANPQPPTTKLPLRSAVKQKTRGARAATHAHEAVRVREARAPAGADVASAGRGGARGQRRAHGEAEAEAVAVVVVIGVLRGVEADAGRHLRGRRRDRRGAGEAAGRQGGEVVSPPRHPGGGELRRLPVSRPSPACARACVRPVLCVACEEDDRRRRSD